MARKNSVRRMWAVVAGAILGAVLGNVIGVYVHSDNLPFFDALGACIGMGAGFALSLWEEARS